MAKGLSLRANGQVKDHANAVVGEILGTAIFLFIAEVAAKTANLGRSAAQTQTNAPLDVATIMMIATSFGLSLLVTAWIFYRITGGLFNPAITVALWLIGAITTARAVFLFIAQLLGGLLASGLVLALTPAGSGGVDVVNTTVSDQISLAQGFFLELLGTSVLVFSVLMLAVEKHRATYLAPVGIGLTLFVIHLAIVAWTGCSLNPARSLGPAVVSKSFSKDHWVYWIAPLAGGMLSVLYFEILKALDYNSALLDQDADHADPAVGLRPVHVRVLKFLSGHKNWERDPNEVAHAEKKHKKRRFVVAPHLHKGTVQDLEASHDEELTTADIVDLEALGNNSTEPNNQSVLRQ